MNIVIDCRHIDSSGIGVYLRECLPFFFNSENNFLLLGNIEKLKFTHKYKNVKVIQYLITPFSLRDIFAFPFTIIKIINSYDLFYSPYFSIPNGLKLPIYITIHDIVFPDIPELTSKLGLSIRMWLFRRAYKKSHTIFTVSNFSKKRIEFFLGNTKPIIVTYSAIQPMFLDYRTKLKNIKKKENIIFIGNMKKNKGLSYLLDAFQEIKNTGLPHRLIIIGGNENFRTSDKIIYDKINSFKDKSISVLSNVSTEQLIEYISEASLLVQPSIYEGFGLPPLEAMILGTRVLISDIPVFKEIYNNFPVVFFRSGDLNDLKEKMLTLLCDINSLSVSLSENFITKYSFKKTTATILRNFTTNKMVN